MFAITNDILSILWNPLHDAVTLKTIGQGTEGWFLAEDRRNPGSHPDNQ